MGKTGENDDGDIDPEIVKYLGEEGIALNTDKIKKYIYLSCFNMLHFFKDNF